MKVTLVLFVLALTLIQLSVHQAQAHIPPEDKPYGCKPGEFYKEGCNLCICGMPDSCRRENCRKGTQAPITERQVQPTRPPTGKPWCKPGEFYKVGCNTCICGILYSCSTNRCPKGTQAPITEKQVQPTRPPKGKPLGCKPGEFYKVGCNLCICGMPDSCRRENCPKGTQAPITQRQVQPTRPPKGKPSVQVQPTRYPKGKRAVQVQPDRLAHGKPTVCKPGLVYKDDCNTCRCGPNGLPFACTKMHCARRTGAPVTGIQVQPTRLPNGKPAACKPGEVYNDGCNTCRCLANGQSACTKMACIKT